MMNANFGKMHPSPRIVSRYLNQENDINDVRPLLRAHIIECFNSLSREDKIATVTSLREHFNSYYTGSDRAKDLETDVTIAIGRWIREIINPNWDLDAVFSRKTKYQCALDALNEKE